MNQRKDKIYGSTLSIILKEINTPSFNKSRKLAKEAPHTQITYTQGDNSNGIWESMKLGPGKYWRDLEFIHSYADFIRLLEPFSLVGHLTFKNDVHPEQADTYYIRLIRSMNEIIIGKNYRDKHIPGISWVKATARQTRGVLHIHYLLDHPSIGKITHNEIRRLWRNCGSKAGRIIQIKRYNSKLGACYYLPKHIFKEDGTVDISEPITWKNRPYRRIFNILSKTNL